MDVMDVRWTLFWRFAPAGIDIIFSYRISDSIWKALIHPCVIDLVGPNIDDEIVLMRKIFWHNIHWTYIGRWALNSCPYWEIFFDFTILYCRAYRKEKSLSKKSKIKRKVEKIFNSPLSNKDATTVTLLDIEGAKYQVS